VIRSRAIASALLLLGLLSATAAHADGAALSDMTGCWLSKDFDATSLLGDSSDPASAEVLHEKMLLRFDRIEGTEHLVFGYIFEWDKGESYVLGPTYENGAFDPVAGTLTFGFPEGGLDTVYALDEATLLYVHRKSSDKSAMSVRALTRIDCTEAATLEQELLAKQKSLN
jgi:hypothetical protein